MSFSAIGQWRFSRLRRAVRFSWNRTLEEWGNSGLHGVRGLIARRLPLPYLRRLCGSLAVADQLAADGMLDDAIALYRAKLGEVELVSNRALYRHRFEWVAFADLLVVDGQCIAAEGIYRRLSAAAPKLQAARQGMENLRQRAGGPVPPQHLKIHFFTIVLNGMPFIEEHIREMYKLPFDWHWHIVEGVASLTHDTAWSRAHGGRIDPSLHRNGLSVDGTTECVDRLATQYPQNITVYRKAEGRFWDGKIEMIRAPLASIGEECLLWEVDADEFWTAAQFERMRKRFIEDPTRTAAFFLCHFFVKDFVITSANTYGNHLAYEWLRVWRYRPGDQWRSHEPPRLCRHLEDKRGWRDLAEINPFTHGETLRDDLVFRHLAYVLPSQLRFKEVYYGYRDALRQWQSLPGSGPVKLRAYLPWIKDGATADDCTLYHIARPTSPLVGDVERTAIGPRPTLYCSATSQLDLSHFAEVLVVKLDNIGDAVMLSPFLREMRRNAPHAKITLGVQTKVFDLVAHCPYVDRAVAIVPRQTAGAFDCDDGAFLSSYRQRAFDLAIVPRWDVDQSHAAAIACNSGARYVVGFSEGANRRKAIENRGYDAYYTDVLPKISPEHEVLQNLALLRFMNATIESDSLEAWTVPADELRAAQLLKSCSDRDLVAIAPAASQTGKSFPTSRLARILDRLPRSLNFVVLGAVEDRAREAFLMKRFERRVLPLCGRLNLRESIAVIRRCKAAIAMDAAPAHFAASVGVPVVVFSMHPRHGGNDTNDLAPARFAPWCPEELRLIVQPDRAWPGCEAECRGRRRQPHCVGNFDDDDAVRSIKAFLARHRIGTENASREG